MPLTSEEDFAKRRRLSGHSSDPPPGSQVSELASSNERGIGVGLPGQQLALAALSTASGIGNTNTNDLLASIYGNPNQSQNLSAYGISNLLTAGQAVPQRLGQVNPQLLQLQQQLGFASPQPATFPSNQANSAQLMAALGLSNPNVVRNGSYSNSLLGGLQQPSTVNEGFIQQPNSAGGSGLLNHAINSGSLGAGLGGLQGLAANSQNQLLSLLASALTSSNGLGNAAGGNQAVAAHLLAQLNAGGTATAPSSDPPGSTSGLSSIKRTRDDADDEKARAIAALENRPAIPNPGLMGRDPIQLYMSCDDDRLSAYHALARRHIEFFEANKDDISTNARGRNRPIVLGQVGIRCRHCSHLPPRRRQRAAMYYPFKLDLLYQACQTLANVHLCEQCEHFPAAVRAELVKLRGEKTTALVGKKYWADGARIHDVYEALDGLRFRPIKEKEMAKKERSEERQEDIKATSSGAPAISKEAEGAETSGAVQKKAEAHTALVSDAEVREFGAAEAPC